MVPLCRLVVVLRSLSQLLVKDHVYIEQTVFRDHKKPRFILVARGDLKREEVVLIEVRLSNLYLLLKILLPVKFCLPLDNVLNPEQMVLMLVEVNID